MSLRPHHYLQEGDSVSFYKQLFLPQRHRGSDLFIVTCKVILLIFKAQSVIFGNCRLCLLASNRFLLWEVKFTRKCVNCLVSCRTILPFPTLQFYVAFHRGISWRDAVGRVGHVYIALCVSLLHCLYFWDCTPPPCSSLGQVGTLILSPKPVDGAGVHKCQFAWHYLGVIHVPCCLEILLESPIIKSR